MTKLTLEKLAEYWKYQAMSGDSIIPDTPYNAVITAEQARELGDDILYLLNRIEKLESIVLKNNES